MSTFELCETVRPLLSAMADGEATPTEAALAEEHVRQCRACASHLAFLRLSHGVLARTPDVFPPADLSARIAAATYAKPSFAARFLGFLRPAPARYALATALTVGIVAVVVSRLPQPVTAPPSVADATRPGVPEMPAVSDSGGAPAPAPGGGSPAAAPAPSPRVASAVAKPAGDMRAEKRVAADSGAGSRRAAAAAPTVVAAAAPAAAARTPRRERAAVPPLAIVAPEPKVAVPNAGSPGTAGETPPAVAVGTTTARAAVPSPRSSAAPSLPDVGSGSPTIASGSGSVPAVAAAVPSSAPSPTVRTPVAEEKSPVAVESPTEDGRGIRKLALKNVDRVADLGEVTLDARGAKGRGAGMNSSFGVADGRGAGITMVDAPWKN